MSFLKKVVLIAIALISILISFSILEHYDRAERSIILSVEVKSNYSDDFQLFYNTSEPDWSEERSIHSSYNTPGKWERIKFKLPKGTSQIRIDTGTKAAKIMMRNLKVTGVGVETSFDKLRYSTHQLEMEQPTSATLTLLSYGTDPYITINLKDNAVELSYWNGDIIKNSGISIFAGLIITFIARYIRGSLQFFKLMIQNRKMILNLAKNDFKTKYASSYLGITWGFIQPLLTIATYWFVFQIGLRNGNVSDVPFILWFLVAIVPWFFFSEALSGATNTFMEYSYLVKKVVFKIELLPSVKVVSAFFVHLFFIAFIFCVYAVYGYYPDIYSFQLLYFIACLIMLVVSISIFTSAIVLFFKDLNQIINIVLQIGFWFTPIGWPITMLSDFWAVIFKLNPMFYIVQGFRDTFINHYWFFERPYQTLYFWVFCLAAYTLGTVAFRKLKPHFSEVL